MKKLLLILAALCALLSFSAASGESAADSAADFARQNRYLETVYSLFGGHGQYYEWDSAARTQWLAALREITPDGSDDAAALDTLLASAPVNGADTEAVDTYLGSRYGKGRAQSISVFYVLEEAWGDSFFWSLEQRAQAWDWTARYFPNPSWDVLLCSLPDETVITPEQAVAAAWGAVSAAQGLPAALADTGFVSGVAYGVGRVYAAEYPPYYTVVFGVPLAEPDDQRAAVTAYYSCSVSGLGEVMDSSYFRATPSPAEDAGEPADFAPLDADGPFSGWTLEEKAAFSQEWQAAMEAYRAEHPNYRGVYYYETLHTYGLPGADSISQEQAGALAREAARALGADDAYLRRADARFYFDVTDPRRPLWKVYLSTIFSRNTAYGDSLGYFVALDADTGAVADAYTRESGRPLEDFR